MILWDNSYVYATDPNKNVRVKRFPDEPKDQAAIQIGYDFFKTNNLCSALKDHYYELKSAGNCVPSDRKVAPQVTLVTEW